MSLNLQSQGSLFAMFKLSPAPPLWEINLSCLKMERKSIFKCTLNDLHFYANLCVCLKDKENGNRSAKFTISYTCKLCMIL